MYHPNELDKQIDHLRTLQESYDQIATAAEAYNVGKTQLAEAITSKGVETSPTESYPEMAEKVALIPLVTTTIDGGEMYTAQQFGDGALWNLYDVLAQMKTRFMGTGDYAALIVCEYYRDYDSLVLQGADGYYTCDGDYYDYASHTHVWHDYDNGKANRWVAFLYREEGARFDITNTNISPRSIYIGGHIGIIEQFVNGRLTEIVGQIESTDIIDRYDHGTYTNNWQRICVMNGVQEWYDRIPCIGNNNIEVLIAKGVKKFSAITNCAGSGMSASLRGFYAPDMEEIVAINYSVSSMLFRDCSNLEVVDLRSLKKLKYLDRYTQGLWLNQKPRLCDVIVGELENDFTTGWGGNLGYWDPTSILSNETAKAQLIDNIKNHILARVSDATGGTQLVFTVSTNMYNNIASEQIEWRGETMSLADAFLTKNWLLAGA